MPAVRPGMVVDHRSTDTYVVMKSTCFKVILFDLGGVLVELDKPSDKTAWFDPRLSARENWDQWLTSPHAQAFERGEISPTDFATRFIADNDVNLTPDELISLYQDWVLGFFPGVFPLLHNLKQHYSLSVFSNITEVHWPEIYEELRSQQCFEHYFASYLIGKAKPDPSAFRYVAKQMRVDPTEVLFVDDNEINVCGAREAGMTADVVQGFTDLESVLSRHDVVLR